ncbi:MAG: fatty acid desaturase [Elusimicrobia bacterium]|nr:fatty acid desaturase [Elusimicrobiota bacterium]
MIRSETGRLPLDYGNIAFLVGTPLAALLGASWSVYHYGFVWFDLFHAIVWYLITGLAVTGGYHRYYAHRSYECGRPLQLYHLVLGAAAAENSVLNWAADHRFHHRFVDTDKDPYNILRGFFYAHIGWVFYQETRSPYERYRNVPDLLKDPLVRWQDRWYPFLVVLMAFVAPTLVGAAFGRPLAGLIWGGFVRIVIVQHMTFLINSAAHFFGPRPYALDNTARDNWWLGPITFGEGYHNFHHKFQADYRNGVRWYQFDLTKWFVLAMRGMGLAWRLKRTPEPLILKARLEVEMQRVENRLAAIGASERLWTKIQSRLLAGRSRFEQAMRAYQHARVEYRSQKRRPGASGEIHRQWAAQLRHYRRELSEARKRWTGLIESLNRLPNSSPQGLSSGA